MLSKSIATKDNVVGKKFTVEDLDCWQYQKEYFVDVLNGEYDLDEAKSDLRSLIGSFHDDRVTYNGCKMHD